MMLNENPYQLIVNDGAYEFNLTEAEFQDLVIKDQRHQKVFIGNKYYDVEISTESDKIFKVTLDGISYKVNINDHYDQLANSLGLHAKVEKKQNHIKSPMPGLVISVLVKAGDTVPKGQPLLILEAMKMENVLKAASDVTVKKVLVDKGKAVEKNSILIEFE